MQNIQLLRLLLLHIIKDYLEVAGKTLENDLKNKETVIRYQMGSK